MSAAPAEPWYIVRKSSVHNLGVFAARDIPKGSRILDYKGHKVTKAESTRRGNAQLEESARTGEGAVYIFVLNKKYDIDGNVPWNDCRLINHTCEPNCEAQIIRGVIWLVATKNIPEGTEIGFNYGFAVLPSGSVYTLNPVARNISKFSAAGALQYTDQPTTLSTAYERLSLIGGNLYVYNSVSKQFERPFYT